jgi:Flp pilus assembly protein TadD
VELGRPVEAEPLARKAVADAPEEPQHLDTLAETLFRLGRREEAVAAARRAAALDTSAYFREQILRFETGPVPAPGR